MGLWVLTNYFHFSKPIREDKLPHTQGSSDAYIVDPGFWTRQ